MRLPSIATCTLLAFAVGVPALNLYNTPAYALDARALFASQPYRPLTIVNNTIEPIYYIRASPIDEDTFSPDLLGDDVIMPGETVTIDLGQTIRTPDGAASGHCFFDLYARFKHGVEQKRFGADICQNDLWTFTDEQFRQRQWRNGL